MTTNARPFTHLESLLLFQSVATYGNTAESFARISASLKNSQLLNRDAPADSDHLNPQALTDLYLRLLKAEAKHSLQNAPSAASQDGKKPDDLVISRRTDVPSPKIATIEDAERHRHLEPLMINRLYDLYKDQVIQEITNEEKAYDELIGQVKHLEFQIEQKDKANAVEERSTTDTETQPSVARAEHNSSIANAIGSIGLEEAGGSVQPSLEPLSTRLQSENVTKRDKSSVPSEPSTPLVSILQDTVDSESQNTVTAKTQIPAEEIKTLPQSNSGKPIKPPNSVPANLSKALGNERSSSSDPSSALQRSDTALNETTQLKADIKGTSSNSSLPKTLPVKESSAVPQPATKLTRTPGLPKQSSVRDHFQPQSAPSHHTSQSPATPHPSSTNRVGGKQLPPFQLSLQATHQSQQPHQSGTISGESLPKQTKPIQERRNVTTPLTKTVGADAKTPAVINQLARIGLPAPTDISGGYSTPGSDTKWKSIPGVPTNPLPRPRSVSPLSDSPSSPEHTPKAETHRRQKTTVAASVRETRRTRTTRASSVTSSAAPSNQARTRSQSIASTEGTDSYFPNATSNIKDVKRETASSAVDVPRSTRKTRGTRNTAATPAVSTPTTSVVPGKRKRAGTLDTDTAATPISTSGRPSPIPNSSPGRRVNKVEKGATQTITATRNFHKTSAPMLNNISSHKHASLFTGPVSSRAAAGYYDIIKRPTDLSSIRKAIAAGHKAVAAATASGTAAADSPAVSTPGATGIALDAATTVTLPLSRELVPPDGIVNAAQLEQEVMRMFANAVMFNDGTDGVVADTREMFEDTEKMFAAWRAAESSREQGEDLSTAGEDAASATSGAGAVAASAKRRRI